MVALFAGGAIIFAIKNKQNEGKVKAGLDMQCRVPYILFVCLSCCSFVFCFACFVVVVVVGLFLFLFFAFTDE